MSDKEETKKIDRVNRKDIKILRALQKKERKLIREYRRWRERECDQIGVYPSWVEWTSGKIVNRDDPNKPIPHDPLSVELRELARKKDDEIQAVGEKFNDCLEKLADTHACAVSGINLMEVDAQGRPTGKQLGEIDRSKEVEQLDSVLGDDDAER